MDGLVLHPSLVGRNHGCRTGGRFGRQDLGPGKAQCLHRSDSLAWEVVCTFREAEAHVGGDGELRVLESADGNHWDSIALVTEKGIDLRDPKLSITPDDRLMITAGGSVYEGKTLLGRQPRVAFSKDGREWSPPQRVLTEGEWLWRVTWYGGKAYGITLQRRRPHDHRPPRTRRKRARPNPGRPIGS